MTTYKLNVLRRTRDPSFPCGLKAHSFTISCHHCLLFDSCWPITGLFYLMMGLVFFSCLISSEFLLDIHFRGACFITDHPGIQVVLDHMLAAALTCDCAYRYTHTYMNRYINRRQLTKGSEATLTENVVKLPHKYLVSEVTCGCV